MAEALLVGSINLATVEEVFETVAREAGGSVRRIPDGEIGPRNDWIFAQVERLARNPGLEVVGADDSPGTSYKVAPSFRVRPGVDPGDVAFDLGYADAALESYDVFRSFKESGRIASETRFQVSLPTQLAVVFPFIAPEDQARLGGVYEEALATDVERIAAHIDAGELAVQWDVSVEMSLIEGVFPTSLSTSEIIDQLVRHADFVPAGVELGYHLCYGDARDETGESRHWKQPEDTSKLVTVANAIVAGAVREVSWIHMPVPIDRDDDAYFAPLAELELPPDTKLYLGLVHRQDGVAGAERRIGAAIRVVGGFGVATECGMGRAPAKAIPELLRIQRECRVPS
ncbi:MAG: hypothetical protein V7607_604 [Solirubrobacteraceae bacterium]